MSEKIPYGLYIERVGAFRAIYDVIDMARDKKILEIRNYGGFKPYIAIFDLMGEEIASIQKDSFWRGTWTIKKNWKKYGYFAETGSICNSEYMLSIPSGNYTINNSRMNSFQGVDELGKFKFFYEKIFGFGEKYKLEIDEKMDPLMALCATTVIHHLLVQQQTAVVVAATV